VILFDFEDVRHEERASDLLRSRLFNGAQSTTAYYQEASFGQFWFEGKLDPEDGDIFGPVTLDYEDSASCDFDRWTADARHKAEDAGFELEGYDFGLYFHASEKCDKSQGRPTWSPPGAFINNLSLRATAHEYGHTLGLIHASGFNCVADGERITLNGTCTIGEYDDPFDIMGGINNASTHLIDGFKRGQAGWLGAANIHRITESGTYI
jgi:hypothetical protein